MRTAIHVAWFLVIFLALLGVYTLLVASFLNGPVYPQEFGYKVGQSVFPLIAISGAIVYFSSARGWLPGIPQARGDA